MVAPGELGEEAAVILGIACSNKHLPIPGFGELRYHAVYERYIDGLLEAVDAAPVLIPAVGRSAAGGGDALAARYVPLLDGLFLPGAISNVDPALYGGRHVEPDPAKRDPDRDATVMPLIRAALGAGVPIFGVCRGMQELNVALGGTLDPALHERPGRLDHRSRKELPFLARYGPAHHLRVAPDGFIARELRARGHESDGLFVNSLHAQGVDVLGRGVVADAWAEDGTIEAIVVQGSPALAIGVQWHIEWHVETTPLHATLLAAFGRACRQRAALRSRESTR